jgi:hypothetical protein
MINKLVFAGCSVTAGNELWEEAHVPNYAKMTFAEARKASGSAPRHELDAFNHAHSYPKYRKSVE